MQNDPTTPQPIAPTLPKLVPPTAVVTVQQIPFTTDWVVQVDGHSMVIEGRQTWPNQEEATAAAQQLLAKSE
jgi:hypothetical protein